LYHHHHQFSSDKSHHHHFVLLRNYITDWTSPSRDFNELITITLSSIFDVTFTFNAFFLFRSPLPSPSSRLRPNRVLSLAEFVA
jgi:hypothetical protein